MANKVTAAFATALVVGLVSGLGAGYLGTSGQIASLQSGLAEKERDIALLQSQVGMLQSEIVTLRQQSVLGIYFSPRGGSEDEIIDWIGKANSSIHILIYSFTLDSIGDALVNAKSRGVDVKIVFEKGQVTVHSEYQRLRAAGIFVRNDTNPNYMHNKVMIVDGVIVATGSFNWTAHAEEENNENLLVIRSTYIATVYEEEFTEIWNQSI